MIRVGPRLLFAMAAISVVALLLSSDFSPISAGRFDDLPDGEEESGVVCTVTSVKQGATGWTMRLTDGDGKSVGAFLSNGKGLEPPLAGQMVVAYGTYDKANEFLFMARYEVVWSPAAG